MTKLTANAKIFEYQVELGINFGTCGRYESFNVQAQTDAEAVAAAYDLLWQNYPKVELSCWEVVKCTVLQSHL